MSHSLRAALIDLDGTLADTLPDFEAAVARLLLELSLPPLAAGTVGQLVGKGGMHLVRRALEISIPGRADELFETAWDAYQHHYADVNGQGARLYPGVPQGLERLRTAGWRLGCVTNKPQGMAEALLAQLDLAQRFELVYGGDRFERRKPDPYPLLRACEALDLPPASVLMIGDSRNDAEAAHAAGCRVRLLTYGYNHGEPIKAVAADGHHDSLDLLVRAVLGGGH